MAAGILGALRRAGASRPAQMLAAMGGNAAIAAPVAAMFAGDVPEEDRDKYWLSALGAGALGGGLGMLARRAAPAGAMALFGPTLAAHTMTPQWSPSRAERVRSTVEAAMDHGRDPEAVVSALMNQGYSRAEIVDAFMRASRDSGAEVAAYGG